MWAYIYEHPWLSGILYKKLNNSIDWIFLQHDFSILLCSKYHCKNSATWTKDLIRCSSACLPFLLSCYMPHVTIWWGQKLGLHTCYNRFNGSKSWAVCCIYLMIKFDYNSAQLSTNSGRMATVCWQDSREGGNKLKSNTRGSFWSQRSMETYLYMFNIFLFDLLYWLSSAWWDAVSSVGYDDTRPNHIYVHVFVSAC